MPRPRRLRWVGFQPNITYFKPNGIRMIDLDESVLTVDEFEAIRLKDLFGLEQEEAAKKMHISQPTFHRLVLSARTKIADAIVNSKAIKIEGGNFKMAPGFRGARAGGTNVCVCPNCGYEESHVRGIPCTSKKCPRCGTMMVGKF